MMDKWLLWLFSSELYYERQEELRKQCCFDCGNCENAPIMLKDLAQ